MAVRFLRAFLRTPQLRFSSTVVAVPKIVTSDVSIDAGVAADVKDATSNSPFVETLRNTLKRNVKSAQVWSSIFAKANELKLDFRNRVMVNAVADHLRTAVKDMTSEVNPLPPSSLLCRRTAMASS